MLFLLVTLVFLPYANGFSPNITDFNAYGSKIAMNEMLFVEAQNDVYGPTFSIQFSPYNSTALSSQCSVTPSNLTNYFIYTVAVAPNQTQFFYIGELMNEQNGTFVGVAKYNRNSASCATGFMFSSTSFTNYQHQDFYVLAVEPQGRYAYGFSNTFIYIYDSQLNTIQNLSNADLIWPDASFMPHAVQFTSSYGIIAGFIINPLNTTAKYSPIIYLINFNATSRFPILVDAYLPNATADTWQDLLTNSDADTYSAKYDMSISINTKGEILIGMQFLNRVFLFTVNINNPIRLAYASRYTGNRNIGNGKGVAWLNDGTAAILVNTYSFTYEWSSSQILFFDIEKRGLNSNSTPLSYFPNNHQVLPLRFSPVLLNIASSPSSLASIDDRGNIVIINPTQPGYYPSVEDTGSALINTLPAPCSPGSYKNQSGVHDCFLCPNGTRNPGSSPLQCLPCLSTSFCSLGAVSDVPSSSLQDIFQVSAYPKSPESTIFDEILIQNMFHLGSGHCLVISPLFWSLLVAALVIIIIIIMAVLKICINHPRAKFLRNRLKRGFRHMDLINEGELWVGGLSSLCLIVLVCFAYAFSARFLQQYPIETSSDSHFSCDLSLRNAKFQTSLLSLSIPVAESEHKMFELLNNQHFLLTIDFVNTLMNCNAISLQTLYGTRWMTTRWANCANNNSILSLSISLPYHQISVKVFLASVQTIGALRIGLQGPDEKDERYHLKALNFRQSFTKYGQIVASSLPINLDITKVINETQPMTGEESEYTGIFIPTFAMDEGGLFYTEDQYMQSTDTLTTVTIEVHETPYYVKNIQGPIAKRSEIIFHNLLFTTVCLELFGLGFLLYKMIIKPLGHFLFPQYFKRKKHSLANGDMHDMTGSF